MKTSAQAQENLYYTKPIQTPKILAQCKLEYIKIVYQLCRFNDVQLKFTKILILIFPQPTNPNFSLVETNLKN